MLRINQSNSAEDEDEALELYDEAIENFKKAHELDPGKILVFIRVCLSFSDLFILLIDNEKLATMVAMFQQLQDAEVYEEEEAEEEEEEEEEDEE